MFPNTGDFMARTLMSQFVAFKNLFRNFKDCYTGFSPPEQSCHTYLRISWNECPSFLKQVFGASKILYNWVAWDISGWLKNKLLLYFGTIIFTNFYGIFICEMSFRLANIVTYVVMSRFWISSTRHFLRYILYTALVTKYTYKTTMVSESFLDKYFLMLTLRTQLYSMAINDWA